MDRLGASLLLMTPALFLLFAGANLSEWAASNGSVGTLGFVLANVLAGGVGCAGAYRLAQARRGARE